MRDDLEIIYMLLFPFVGNGFQLAPCNVSWLATRGSVVLVPDPIVFAPWSVHLDRGEPCDSCQDTSHEAASACFLSQEWPVTGETHSMWTESVWVVGGGGGKSQALSQVHRKGDLGDEVDGMKGDTTRLLSDKNGNCKRGVLCGHLERHV